MDVVAENGREALVMTARAVMAEGRQVSPRGMLTRELPHFSAEIRNPRDVLCLGINSGQSQRVAAAEAVQLIGGFSEPKFAVRNAPKLKDFLNEDGGFDGAYGPRLHDQFGHLERRLREDHDTRQAILSVWNQKDLSRYGSKDYPCTLVLGFAIRQERLEMNVTMRSNDVNWGFKNDIFQFTQLQLSIAGVLDLEPGAYRHTAFSMHVYERDWDWADGLDLRNNEPIDDHPQGIAGRTVEEMMWRARTVALTPSMLYDPTPSDRWYEERLA